MFTTAQAAEGGIARKTLSGLANAGSIERVAQGVYRMAGVPAAEVELDTIRVHWLALGGALRPLASSGAHALIAAGITAATIHQIGDWFSGPSIFIVPERRVTRLRDVRLRVRALRPDEITIVDGLPTMTVERTIADLAAAGEDLSLVAGAVGDAVQRGTLTSVGSLTAHLDQVARRQGYDSGASYTTDLFRIAEVPA